MARRLIPLLTLVLLAAAGCNMFAPPPANQTLAAQRDFAGTQVADARASATPAVDLMSVTVEAAQTSVARSASQSTRIAATLFALGTPFVDIRFITPEAPTQPPVAPGGGSVPGAGGPPAVQPTVIGQGSAQGNATLLAPPPAQPPPGAEVTADPASAGGPALINGVITDRVGADDCAVGSMSSFAPNALGVYIVATAINIPSGSQLTARFLNDGIEQVFYDWTPNFNISEGCVWFYMPASDVSFTAGNWSAQIELNGPVALPPVAFTVTGGDDMAGG
ncbi:MAG TPA: hypothetical protein VER79_12115 [Candidatus Limnocylindrales bacterium]|nr:hypothetical protein [Candidatus Limnocylindrales bacterium]